MSSKQKAILIISVSFVFVVLCILYTKSLEKAFATQEQKRVKEWAEATEMLITADENTDISFITSIIENNTTIPVYMLDADYNIISTRNVKKAVKDPTGLNGPIIVKVSEDIVQYIYYEDSLMLRKLRYFPYIEFSLILIFLTISIYTLVVSLRNEQNMIWVGLCRETAHQLGTPISSLFAWHELLSAEYPTDSYLPQLSQDIERLSVIAQRFSKIGSEPTLQATRIAEEIEKSIEYMRKRSGAGVCIDFISDTPTVSVMLDRYLFSWVIENMIKNALDAMKGVGKITFSLFVYNNDVIIDISDTGKGMDKKTRKKVFMPGFTTKQRGWGLGLSLCKRIITRFFHGDVFVLRTAVNKGTTMRITLPKLG